MYGAFFLFRELHMYTHQDNLGGNKNEIFYLYRALYPTDHRKYTLSRLQAACRGFMSEKQGPVSSPMNWWHNITR